MVVVTAPPDAVDQLLDVISSAGGGIIGDYTHCAFTSPGTGRFKPSAEATPHMGAKEQINGQDSSGAATPAHAIWRLILIPLIERHEKAVS